MVTGIAPLGRLIDKLPLVVPSIVLLECPRFSAENSDWNDPDVTRSTSVKVPIGGLKYRIACELAVGYDSRSGYVAVWVMTAPGADRSRRPSRGRTAGMSRRRCRRPRARVEPRRSRTVGRYICGPSRGDASSSPRTARKPVPETVLGEPRLES